LILNASIASRLCRIVLYSKHPAPPDIHTLSLHDALPISQTKPAKGSMIYSKNLLNLNKTRLRTQTNAGLQPKALPRNSTIYVTVRRTPNSQRRQMPSPSSIRSEEHTSELQSRFDLVCRLLL